MNYNVDRLIRRSRVIGFFILEENYKDTESIRTGILETVVRLKTKYIPVLVKYTSEPASNTPVVVYYKNNINGTLTGTYVHYNGYELMSNFILWATQLYNTPTEQLILDEKNGKSIFDDYRYRIFSDNIMGKNFKLIMKETFEKIYANSKKNQESKALIIYILGISMVILSLALNFLGMTPLQKNVRNLRRKTTKLFKYIPRGSLKDIVSRYDDNIESITQLYDISFDNKKEGGFGFDGKEKIYG
ncbi:hypothetical protein PIROE2DRAFT_14255 [Piromyces sp. E2]|nr:hypothetical protein PIROE2DRAFT_14255 [Piromyces sp. E2]|eukprot:OUM60063.1 hypothetical protein PIROE2DRAFT_14255 [Piromyces sp. E2]